MSKANMLNNFKVKDVDGNLYTLNPFEDNTILSIHVCTSYLQFEVQYKEINDEGRIKYKTRELFYKLDNANFVDLISLVGCEECEILIGE